MTRVHESTHTLQYSRAVLQLALRTEGAAVRRLLETGPLLQLAQSLGDCVWGLIESPLDSTRHNVKNTLARILNVLAMLREDDGDPQGKFLLTLLAMSWRSRAKYSALSVAFREPSARMRLLEEDAGLPGAILGSLGEDPTISGHCSELYKLCLREFRKDTRMTEEQWRNTWVRPLLSHSGEADQIGGILEAALAAGDKVLEFVTEELSSQSTPTEGGLITLLVILKSKKKKTGGWKGYLDLEAFRRAQNHYSDKVRH